MAFDFSYMDKKDIRSEHSDEPLVKVWNHKGNPKKLNSYFFLNKHAVALLNNATRVKVGIDTQTKKIVITPARDGKGRQLSRMAAGSATVALKALIEDNNIPCGTFKAGYLQNYAHGGLIFNYEEVEEEEEE